MRIKRKTKKRRKTIKKYKLKKDKFKRGRGFWGNLNDGLKKAYGYY